MAALAAAAIVAAPIIARPVVVSVVPLLTTALVSAASQGAARASAPTQPAIYTDTVQYGLPGSVKAESVAASPQVRRTQSVQIGATDLLTPAHTAAQSVGMSPEQFFFQADPLGAITGCTDPALATCGTAMLSPGSTMPAGYRAMAAISHPKWHLYVQIAHRWYDWTLDNLPEIYEVLNFLLEAYRWLVENWYIFYA